MKRIIHAGITICIVALCSLCFYLGCSSGDDGGVEGVSTDQRVNDLDGATGVPIDSTFTYAFSQVVDPATVTATSFFLLPTPTATAMTTKRAIDTAACDVANALDASISCSSTTCTLDPTNDLNYYTNYTLCLTTDIGYAQGTESFDGFMAQFTTEASTAVAANLVMVDGTTRQLTDTPLPLNLGIQVTFPVPVDTALAEALFSLMDGSRTVSTTRTWNADGTVMTAKPTGRLDLQTTYSVMVDAGAVTSSENVDTYSADFTTMVAGDINGDGMADLITNAIAWDSDVPADVNTGRVYLFYGNAVSTGSAAAADAIITGEASGDNTRGVFSTSINLDINDDGYADLFCISATAPGGVGDGRNYIFFGGSDAPISGSLNAANADVVLEGTAAEHLLALYVGDVNGDGLSDLVGTATGCNGGQGCVYVFYGPAFASETSAGADVVIGGEGAGDVFGIGIRLADINGDGIDDIIASAIGYDADVPADANKGRIYVFHGRSDLASVTSAAQADVAITGASADDRLRVFNVADVDGDGLKDIIALAQTYSAGNTQGAAYIFYAANLASGDAGDADIGLTGDAANDQFGVLTFTGDVTGDGTLDVIVGASGYDDGAIADVGQIHVFTGESGLTSESAANADIKLMGENAGDALTLTAVGDVNGDGIDDIICGSGTYPASDPVPNVGRIYAFFGGSSLATGNAAAADVIITGEQGDDRLSPGSILDVNGDGTLDIFGVARGWQGGGNTGRGYLFHGGSALTTQGAASAAAIIDGEGPGDQLGN